MTRKGNSAAERHLSPDGLKLRFRQPPPGRRENSLLFEPDVGLIQTGERCQQVRQAGRVFRRKRVLAEPPFTQFIDLTMPRIGGFVFRLKPVDILQRRGSAHVPKLPHSGEEVLFFIRDVLWSRLAKVLQRGFERAAVFRIERTAPGLRRHRDQRLKEPLDAPVAIREETDGVGKRALRGADENRHGYFAARAK